jgi:hypothetical protein
MLTRTRTHTRARCTVVSTKYGLINTERAPDPPMLYASDDEEDGDNTDAYDTDYYMEYEGYAYGEIFGYPGGYDSDDMGCGCPHCMGMYDDDMY